MPVKQKIKNFLSDLVKRPVSMGKLLTFLTLQAVLLQAVFMACAFSHSCSHTASASSCASGIQQSKSGPSTQTASQGNLICSGDLSVGTSGANTFSSLPSVGSPTVFSTFLRSKLGQSLPELAQHKEDEKPKAHTNAGENCENTSFKRRLGRINNGR